MSALNQQQRAAIEAYLDEQGLTMLPLRNEMMDHLICDIESHLARGSTFEEAWQLTTREIPSGHFRNIQTETMEAVDKRMNWSRGLTTVALTLLLAAAVFKLLELQYADILLFASFGVMIVTLVTGATSGARLHKQKKGKLVLAAVITGVVLFLLLWCAQVLQLPGFGSLRMITAPFLILLFSALTVYFRTRDHDNDHILTYLHEKHTPGINRFLVILLAIGVVLKLVTVTLGYGTIIAHVVLALVIGGAGLQFFALQWQHEPRSTKSVRNYGIQTTLIVGFVAFMIPMLAYSANISPSTKMIVAAIFYLLAGGVIVSESSNKMLPIILVAISWVYILAWTAIHLSFVEGVPSMPILSAAVLIILIGGLVASRRSHTLVSYMILPVAHFVLFYPW